MNRLTIDPAKVNLQERYQLLIGSVTPRPIAWVSTISRDEIVNLSPFSFFNCFSNDPPIVGFSAILSGVDGHSKDTLNNVKEVPEVVINMVNYSMVSQMVQTSQNYDSEINEFDAAQVKSIPAIRVKPPRVKNAPIQLECRVTEILPFGKNRGAGNLVLCEVLLMHFDDHLINDRFQIDAQKCDLVGRLGANNYCRVNEDSIFSVPKLKDL